MELVRQRHHTRYCHEFCNAKNMSSAEHKQMVEKITRGLEIAEREMLEEKARNNEDVIVCGDDNVIRHIPAKNFL